MKIIDDKNQGRDLGHSFEKNAAGELELSFGSTLTGIFIESTASNAMSLLRMNIPAQAWTTFLTNLKTGTYDR